MSEPLIRDAWCGEGLYGHTQGWCYCVEIAALRQQLATVTGELEQEHCDILVCSECGRTSKHGWIGVVYESTPNSAEEYDTKCPECGSMSLDEDARSVVNELDTCKAQLATVTQERDEFARKYELVRHDQAKQQLARAQKG